jgi:hypothetical protein
MLKSIKAMPQIKENNLSVALSLTNAVDSTTMPITKTKTPADLPLALNPGLILTSFRSSHD